MGAGHRLSTLGLATKTIKTVDRNSQQLVLPFVLPVFSSAVKRFRESRGGRRKLCLPQFSRDMKQDRQTASLLLNSPFIVVIFCVCVFFPAAAARKCILKIVQTKMGKMQSIFSCCAVLSSACLSLANCVCALADVAFCFATSGCSSCYINISFSFFPALPLAQH